MGFKLLPSISRPQVTLLLERTSPFWMRMLGWPTLPSQKLPPMVPESLLPVEQDSMPVDLIDQVMEDVLPLRITPPVVVSEEVVFPSDVEGTKSTVGSILAGK
ncbi:UNVERIFIED_CONTAM: hypothetical protein Sradi_1567800 [Sesamum radiatum]|uniref:Uncharacterized protein n=1 Tax=Sesamum radiatum TaxID=300843 RepID=A0AAW2U8J4_SESRA